MPHLRIPSPPTWESTPQEEWVWERLCAGEIANFNEAKGYGGTLDPKEPEGWPEKRILQEEGKRRREKKGSTPEKGHYVW